MTKRTRTVGTRLLAQVYQPCRVMLQVAVSGAQVGQLEESLRVDCDGRGLQVREVVMADGSRVHLLQAPPGQLTVEYEASVVGDLETGEVTSADRIEFVRPSRYAESDRLVPTAEQEFAGIVGSADLLSAVSSWTGARLSYVPGSSGPTDGAVDTLLSRRGVCRDYAHLVIALLRALDVPARFAAVYAPGLDPMDFHAVAEAAIDGRWRVVDATLLAPRGSLVRIATGRDAADTSFMSTYGGAADLLEARVTAVTSGELPADDVRALVSLT
ncbi:MAG: transglutaminase family protein [Actinomycetota bacterium]|nr:transglutaminase family protein [Actinomycetota bacterium]